MPAMFDDHLSLLLTYLKPHWRRALVLAGLLLAGIALQLINPFILRRFIDTAKMGGPEQALTTMALLFVAVVCTQQVVSALQVYLGEDVGWKTTNLLRNDLFLHSLRLDLSFHKAHPPGEMIERIDGDVSTLSNFFSQFVIRVLGNGLLVIAILVIVFREDWRVGLTLVGYTLAVLAVLQRIHRTAVPYFMRFRQAAAELAGFWEERLSMIEDLRPNDGTSYVMNRYHELMRRVFKASLKSGLTGGFFRSSWETLFAISMGLIFALGAYLLNRGEMTIGTVYLIFYLLGLLSWNLQAITAQLQDLQRASACIQRVKELRQTKNQITSNGGVQHLPSGPLSVELRRVFFGYEQEDSILRDLSLRIEPGRVLGLLGRTGSGKTTLIRLLFRFYDPEAGEVLLGDLDIRRTSLPELRRRIGLVTQDVQLFRGTVRQNVTLFDPSISDRHITHAIQELGLGEWLASLPRGLDTELPSGGAGLSAGECQLLAFVRAFLNAPDLVVLDEACSRLDPATEYLIDAAVERLLHNRTAVIIAHRPATVRRAHEILILEDGRIREYGERVQLQSDQGSSYHRLLRTGLEEVLV
jgi:ATP-binding cassette subfamily B protein